MIRSSARLLTLVAACVVARLAAAQADTVPPRPSSAPTGPALTNAAGQAVDGWAVVRYSVLADGSLDNVRVLGIVPPSADASAATETLGRWTLEPAMRSGEPIDWHNNESVVFFDSGRDRQTVSEAFESGYTAIVDRLTAIRPPEDSSGPDEALAAEYVRTLEESRAANRQLLNEQAVTLGEQGVALAQAAIIDMTLGDTHSAYEFARLATDARAQLLVPADLFAALGVRLQLEIQLGRTHDAIATHDRIASGYAPDDVDTAAEVMRIMRTRWAEEEILPVFGRIADHPWRFDARRRTFTISDIAGELSTIEADCDLRRLSLNFQADVEWQLPDFLGDCTLFVHGTPGTTFSFFEMLPATE